tara:strand:+ start:346 stop:1362 length:1017 start_codon:yes stop_codon:yes gene_type:complete
MQLNTTTLVDRFNRPSVGGKVAVRTLFINNGEFIDPYDVSSCTIFARTSNLSPSSVLSTTDGLIKAVPADLDTSTVLMSFGVSGNPGTANLPHDGDNGRVTSLYLGWVSPTATTLNGGADFSTEGYFPHTQASGIYRTGVGDYVAVLDGVLSVSGVFNNRYGFEEGLTIANAASAVQEYVDVWTVKLFQESEYQVFVNTFSLYNDTFTTITEPLLLTTRNKLLNKKLRLGEKIQMKVTTDITVQNRTLSEETKNILKEYQITDPKITINKVTDDSVNQVPWSNVVSGTAATTTTDNTILYTYDTTAGSVTGAGTYFATVSYSYLTEDFVSPPFYFTIS